MVHIGGVNLDVATAVQQIVDEDGDIRNVHITVAVYIACRGPGLCA